MKAGPNQRQSRRQGLDLHQTPEVAVTALLFKEQVPLRCWDPSCGPGSIVRALSASGRDCFGSDIAKHEGFRQFNFFRAKRANSDCIVMNPPYRLATEFIHHALDLAPEVYALLRLNWFSAVRPRHPHLYDRLARVHCFAPRLPMMHRDGWTGPKATSQFDHAWFCWQPKPPMYGTVIDRVNWRKL